MIKVLLVDDEEDVRLGLLEEVNWNEHGFEVVDKAENGREAMELFEKIEPDIVVTDIHMPFMNGIELAGWIREQTSITKIVILTGYDEFEYAQKAITLQIDEYVLKPFSSQEILNVMLKVKQQIEQEVEERRDKQDLIQHYERSLPVLRELFLSSLLTRRWSGTEILDKMKSYGLDQEIVGSGYIISVIRMDEQFPDQDRHLLLFAVMNVASEIIQKHQEGRLFVHEDDIVLLTIAYENDQEKVIRRTLHVLEEVRHSVHTYLKLTVTIGTGSFCWKLDQLIASHKEALQALDYRLLLGNNRVIWIQDVENRQGEPLLFDEHKRHALVRSLKIGTQEEIVCTLEDLFEGTSGKEHSVQEWHIYLIEILTSMIKVSRIFNIELMQWLGYRELPFTDIYRLNNLEEARRWITKCCLALSSMITASRQLTTHHLVEEAKDYISTHYQENDLSITRVCKELHISTGYFSHLFKKEMKMTFVNYVMQIRMEAAKELLRSTDLKAFEIAERIGFSDPNYFSFCFRKNTGFSPKEYRMGAKGVTADED